MAHPPRNPRPAHAWLSIHARRRCAQRGTNAHLLAAVRDWADVEVPVGNGAVAVSLSRSAAAEMRAEGIRSDLIERALRRALVEGEGSIVTLIAGRERRGRRYRRAMTDGRRHRGGRR